MSRAIPRAIRGSIQCAALLSVFCGQANSASGIGVADASLQATFYADASCLLTINSFVQPGNTVIDADVDPNGSRMFIHCDTEDGKRLTILARGDSLHTEQSSKLLNRTQIADGEFGMLAWLTRPNVHYEDDTAPRRYVIGGSVKLRKSPAVNAVATALNSEAHSFASINGVLEPIVKSEAQSMQLTPTESLETNAESAEDEASEIELPAAKPATLSSPIAESGKEVEDKLVR